MSKRTGDWMIRICITVVASLLLVPCSPVCEVDEDLRKKLIEDAQARYPNQPKLEMPSEEELENFRQERQYAREHAIEYAQAWLAEQIALGMPGASEFEKFIAMPDPLQLEGLIQQLQGKQISSEGVRQRELVGKIAMCGGPEAARSLEEYYSTFLFELGFNSQVQQMV